MSDKSKYLERQLESLGHTNVSVHWVPTKGIHGQVGYWSAHSDQSGDFSLGSSMRNAMEYLLLPKANVENNSARRFKCISSFRSQGYSFSRGSIYEATRHDGEILFYDNYNYSTMAIDEFNDFMTPYVNTLFMEIIYSTPHCNSCHTPLVPSDDYIRIEDGRRFCDKCYSRRMVPHYEVDDEVVSVGDSGVTRYDIFIREDD